MNAKTVLKFLGNSTEIRGVSVPNWVLVLSVFAVLAGMPSPKPAPEPPRTPVEAPEPVATPVMPEPSPTPVTTPENQEIKPRIYESDVRAKCKQLAESDLINPRSARHELVNPTFDPHTKMWTLNSWIEAKNQYNATVRTRYKCSLVDGSGIGFVEWGK